MSYSRSTGIVRKVEELGRIVLPNELRSTPGIEVKDPIEIFLDGNLIILKKYEPGCTFCGNIRNGTFLKGRNICFECFRGDFQAI